MSASTLLADFAAALQAQATLGAGTFASLKNGTLVSAANFFEIKPVVATANGQVSFPLVYTPGAVMFYWGGSFMGEGYTAGNGTTIELADGTGVKIGDKGFLVILRPFSVADALPLNGTAADSARLGGVLASAVSADIASRVRFKQASAQLTTSGNFKDFPDIDPWAKEIIISYSGIKVSAIDSIVVQLGTAAGIDLTNYASGCSYVGGTNQSGGAVSTTSILTTSDLDANLATVHGTVTLTKHDGNTWVAAVSTGRSNAGFMHLGAGTKTLADVLTQLRITFKVNTTQFTAGSVNVTWKG